MVIIILYIKIEYNRIYVFHVFFCGDVALAPAIKAGFTIIGNDIAFGIVGLTFGAKHCLFTLWR